MWSLNPVCSVREVLFFMHDNLMVCIYNRLNVNNF